MQKCSSNVRKGEIKLHRRQSEESDGSPYSYRVYGTNDNNGLKRAGRLKVSIKKIKKKTIKERYELKLKMMKRACGKGSVNLRISEALCFLIIKNNY